MLRLGEPLAFHHFCKRLRLQGLRIDFLCRLFQSPYRVPTYTFYRTVKWQLNARLRGVPNDLVPY